jgi:hypothetical protein
MNETYLAKRIIDYLEEEHWDIYQEVQFNNHSGIADICAVRDGKVWIIECKTSLTFTVLEQAQAWKCHYRSIAVPEGHSLRGRRTAYDIAKNYFKVGVLILSDRDGIIERKSAPLMREFHISSKKMIAYLKPEHKFYSEAGANNGRRWTPFQATMSHVKNFIAGNPGCSLKQIIDDVGKSHYANKTSAISGVRVALENYSPWCEIKIDIHGNRKYYVVMNEKQKI